jgi:hypothetical protein
MEDHDKQEDSDHHTDELIMTTNQLFNNNPFEGIMKATNNCFRWAGNCKKKSQQGPCDEVVTQSNIAACQEFLEKLQEIGRCFDYRDKAFKNSECVTRLSKDGLHDGSTFLVALANQEKPLCDAQLKGTMAAAIQNQVTKTEMKKKLWQAG